MSDKKFSECENGWSLLEPLASTTRHSEFVEKGQKVLEVAFKKVFERIEEGTLTWRRTLSGLKGKLSVVATITLSSADGKLIGFDLIFTCVKRDDSRYIDGFLISLGTHGPQRFYERRDCGERTDTDYLAVKKLAQEVFQIDVSEMQVYSLNHYDLGY